MTIEDRGEERILLVEMSVPIEDAELLCDELWLRGVPGVEEVALDSNVATFRTSLGADPTGTLEMFRRRFPRLRWQVAEFDRNVADWWRTFAEPTLVTDDVAFVPAWTPAPDVSMPILVEPFDTFGLGNHPTTVLAARLCLRAMRTGFRVFDLGCGSGVLSVLLAKCGAASVTVHDIFPACKEAVAHNADLNDVSDDLLDWIGSPDLVPPGSVDLLVANILAPVLRDEAARIRSVVAADGVVVLSGMRTDQVGGVTTFYEPFSLEDHETLDGWTAVTLRLHSER